MKSNYDKQPFVRISDKNEDCMVGWDEIIAEIHRKLQQCESKCKKIVVDCYSAVDEHEVMNAFRKGFKNSLIRHTFEVMCSKSYIDSILYKNITYDQLFGYMSDHDISRFFSFSKNFSYYSGYNTMEYEIYVGAGASHLCPNADVLIYIDMARREIRKRFTENSATNLASNRYMSNIFRKLKVAYFIDWRVLDRYKKTVLKKCDYIIDANQMENPKMISRQLFDESLKITVSKPFRLVPSFESGISGGQWMKKTFDLDTESKNYQTCFDCIAEENSLMFAFGDTFFEIPAMDLVFKHPEKLLGTRVFERFGDEFPIRFNIIDTMRGKNMNLEVHPTDDYMKEKFGMKYAQDESYYLLDAKDDSAVYLGLNEDVDPETMISDLGDMYSVGKFEIDKYVTRYPVVKHDHLLIPAGTVHSLGQNCVALEIATSPYIFAFKLWEANRFTFEYEMYPLNVKRGIEVIQWDRRELSVQSELINHFETLQREECLHEERTGLHDFAFIETRRHRFKKTVFHRTEGSVNVLNLVSGREVIVESPSGRFEPLIVHYAETFIIPNCVGEYTIRPYGESEGKYCITIKAFVRPETMPQS